MLNNRRGSILIEGLASIFLIGFALLVNLEVTRRVWLSLTLHYAAFDSVRSAVLQVPQTQANHRLRSFFLSAWPNINGWKLKRQSELTFINIPGREFRAHYHLRYPAYLRVGMETFTKHHFEVTEVCRFPYSLD